MPDSDVGSELDVQQDAMQQFRIDVNDFALSVNELVVGQESFVL